MKMLQNLARKRKSLRVVQFFFFAAVGCLYPFLSIHMTEIGLTGLNAAYINCLSPILGLLIAPLSGMIAHKYNKYQTLLVISLLGSTICYTALLFIPRVIMNPRHPQIMFDCTNNQLKMEMCSDWNGQCSKPKKLAIGNYTNFELTRCNFICPSSLPFNSSWYPMSVCFASSSEKKLCLLHDPELADRGSGWTKDVNQGFGGGTEQLIQFDSRFDRWPVSTQSAEEAANKDCVYQAVAPLIVNHKPYETIQCRPYIQNCYVHCKVNMLHRPQNSKRSKPPDPCYDVIGDPIVTFYSYLGLRSGAEMFAFTAYNLLDALSVTLENNFDTLFGGLPKALSTPLPLMIFPIVTGVLIDYYSSLANQADYAPCFILYDGVILIATALVIAAPVAPLVTSESINFTTTRITSASTSSLRSTPSLRALKTRIKIPRENWYIFCSTAIPLTLISGIIWATLQVHLYPFYLQLGYNKVWISAGFVMIFTFYAPFCLLGKKLVTGIGRLHLVLVGLLFYSIRLTAISFLSRVSWMLLPLEAMEAFTLPITWIGLTSYSHHLITTSVRPELMSRLGVDPATSTHLKMQYFLNFLHYGLGKVVGCALWAVWLIFWSRESVDWSWLNLDEVDLPEIDSNGFRIWLRLVAIICASLSLAALFFTHIFGVILNYTISLGKEIILCLSICKKRCLNCLSQACCCKCTCKLPKCNICKTKKRKNRRGKKHKSRKRREEEDREDEEDYYGTCGNGSGSGGGVGGGTTVSTSLTNTADHPGSANNYSRLMDNSPSTHLLYSSPQPHPHHTHDQHHGQVNFALPNGHSKHHFFDRSNNSSRQSTTSLELLPKKSAVSHHRRQSACEATQTHESNDVENEYLFHPHVDHPHHHHHHHTKRVLIDGITEEDESLLDPN